MVLNSIHTLISLEWVIYHSNQWCYMSFYVVLKLGPYFYCSILYFYRLAEWIIKYNHAFVEYLLIKCPCVIRKCFSYVLTDQFSANGSVN